MVLSFFIPNSLQTSCIRLDSRLVPPSDNKASGSPNMGPISSINILTSYKLYKHAHVLRYNPLVIQDVNPAKEYLTVKLK